MPAGTTLVSVEEYLGKSYEPNCEYIDGVLRQKPMPTGEHSTVEDQIVYLVKVGFPDFAARTELTVRIRPTRFLIPDVAIQRRDRIQKPYPIDPVHVCIEVVSPTDRLVDVFDKCKEYHDWGVEMAWVVDPATQRGWEYRKGQAPVEVPPDGSLTAEGLSLRLADVFTDL